MRRLAMTFLAVVVTAPPVLAQEGDAVAQAPPDSIRLPAPFGLEVGTSLSELKEMTTLEAMNVGYYRLATVPAPHADFEMYAVLASETHGVCKVVALTGVIETSVYGTGLVNAFERTQDALADRYGEPSQEYDFLSTGSIWDEPRDWMRAVERKERVLSVYWNVEDMAPGDSLIHAIGLEAFAIDDTAGGLQLQYEFATFKECRAEINEQKNAVF